MKRALYLVPPLCLLLSACAAADAPATASSSGAALTESPAATPEEAGVGWEEQIDIDEDYTAYLRDGTPFRSRPCRFIIKETGGERPGRSWRRKLALQSLIFGH